jgi:hypothetical protein
MKAYEEETSTRQNAKHSDIDGLHLVTVATEDIPEGHEVR